MHAALCMAATAFACFLLFETSLAPPVGTFSGPDLFQNSLSHSRHSLTEVENDLGEKGGRREELGEVKGERVNKERRNRKICLRGISLIFLNWPGVLAGPGGCE